MNIKKAKKKKKTERSVTLSLLLLCYPSRNNNIDQAIMT